ncbi:MAG TPA: 23S rRNA (pseudouridine(1915)-N(3))-methyltransferase RlmH [Candidatus Dorea intestinavium]|nr:23S rRNA (pseudouridine(1915)-N(3))-methyltransferase RlmH [Candidatus Dorea intestinavium]
MRINLITVGKLKEKYLKDAVKEYEKRLSKYCKLTISEVADEKTPEDASLILIKQIKDKEGERILKKIPEKAFVIALAIEGDQVSSLDLANFLDKSMVSGISDITFIIGGSLGLSNEVLKRANKELSFSKLTFPHQLMRVLLLEQVYRCFRIIAKEPYHK